MTQESRTLNSGRIVRRRRLCSNGHLFTTYEMLADDLLVGRKHNATSITRWLKAWQEQLPS